MQQKQWLPAPASFFCHPERSEGSAFSFSRAALAVLAAFMHFKVDRHSIQTFDPSGRTCWCHTTGSFHQKMSRK